MKKRYLPLVLIAALTLTACGKGAESSEAKTEPAMEVTVDDSISNEDSEAVPASPETPSEEEETEEVIGYEPGLNVVDGRYVFNPHVFSKRDTEVHGVDKKEAMFNLCDALIKGEDTFEADNEDAYGWAIGGRFINYYFPFASNLVSDGRDEYGTNGTEECFENGVGKIYYNTSKEELQSMEKQFAKDIEDVLNEYVKPEYSDFEKALALYIYMTRNYIYDYDALDESGNARLDYEAGTYKCFTTKKGICMEFGGVYSYLLLQCGVEADVISALGGGNPNHQWTFVNIDGKDYHVDPTYGLSTADFYDGNIPLEYFLMSDQDRDNAGFNSEYFYINGLGDESRAKTSFYATNNDYSELHNGYFVDMDTDRNVVIYHDYFEDVDKEFKYE